MNPGPATSTRSSVGNRRKVSDDRLGNVARRTPGTLRRRHPHIHRPVAVVTVATRFDDELDPVEGWERAISRRLRSAQSLQLLESRRERVIIFGRDRTGRRSRSTHHRYNNDPPPALVAQGIEHRPPEPGAQVRILPRAQWMAAAKGHHRIGKGRRPEGRLPQWAITRRWLP